MSFQSPLSGTIFSGFVSLDLDTVEEYEPDILYKSHRDGFVWDKDGWKCFQEDVVDDEKQDQEGKEVGRGALWGKDPQSVSLTRPHREALQLYESPLRGEQATEYIPLHPEVSFS